MDNASSGGNAAVGSRGMTVGGTLFVALSLSIGWGIRGNFGHEYGAMIAGVLSAIAVCLASGREDWWRRVPYFAFFGGIGWSFGGSISYMQVIAYTHSGHLPSQVYGFACLFVIGFTWAAMGAGGTALPAVLSREKLSEIFVPLIVVFIAWWGQDCFEAWYEIYLEKNDLQGASRHESPLYWFDTDWLGILVAMGAVLLHAAVVRNWSTGTSIVMHMGVGWYAAFLFLVVAMNVRMTPPRGDNWAGAVGATGGMLVFFMRSGLFGAARAAIVAGFIGGLGFSGAQMIKLICLWTGVQTNWHSVLEQTYGFINGIGIAVAMGSLVTRLPRVNDDPPVRRWTEPFAAAFVLLGVTYVNVRKDIGTWIEKQAIPAEMFGLRAGAGLIPSYGFVGWFDLIYLAMTAAVVILLIRHMRHPLPMIPSSWAGKGQLLYLVFLWWMVIGNWMRAIPGFTAHRLVTEGVIHLNASICMVLAFVCAARVVEPSRIRESFNFARGLPRTILAWSAATILAIGVQTGVARALYGDEQAPASGRHIRFGPDATATKAKPKPGQAHP
jgi:hypothetical protein